MALHVFTVSVVLMYEPKNDVSQSQDVGTHSVSKILIRLLTFTIAPAQYAFSSHKLSRKWGPQWHHILVRVKSSSTSTPGAMSNDPLRSVLSCTIMLSIGRNETYFSTTRVAQINPNVSCVMLHNCFSSPLHYLWRVNPCTHDSSVTISLHIDYRGILSFPHRARALTQNSKHFMRMKRRRTEISRAVFLRSSANCS